MALSKYMHKREIDDFLGETKVDPTFLPMSQDSYNEAAILKSILDSGKKVDLLMAAINLACVGFGNRKYGQFKLRDKLIEIAILLAAAGVKYGLTKDAKLLESDLTPQRLCRAFRHHIKAYIEETKYETYIFRKYSTHDAQYASILFRGSEYLEDLRKDEVDYILQTYEAMDAKTNLNLSDRIIRVFQAKGYIRKTPL
jgi:hypothetical protein